jgi:hypothetical protein
LIYFIIVLIFVFARSKTINKVSFEISQKIPEYYIAPSLASPSQSFSNLNKPLCQLLCNEQERIEYHNSSHFSQKDLLLLTKSTVLNSIGKNASICFANEKFNIIATSYTCYNLFDAVSGIALGSNFVVNFDYKFDTLKRTRNLMIYSFDTKPPEKEIDLNQINDPNNHFFISLASDFVVEEIPNASLRTEEYLLYFISIFTMFGALFSIFDFFKEVFVEIIFDVDTTTQEKIRLIPLFCSHCCIIFIAFCGIITFSVLFYNFEIIGNANLKGLFEYESSIPEFSKERASPDLYFSNEWKSSLNCAGSNNYACNLKCDSPQSCNPQKQTSDFFTSKDLFSYRSPVRKVMTQFFPSICFHNIFIFLDKQFLCFQLKKNHTNTFYIYQEANFVGSSTIIYQMTKESSDSNTWIELASPKYFLNQNSRLGISKTKVISFPTPLKTLLHVRNETHIEFSLDCSYICIYFWFSCETSHYFLL